MYALGDIHLILDYPSERCKPTDQKHGFDSDFKESTITGFWTHVNFMKFAGSRSTVEHHNKANRRLTWGYDPENRHVGRNDVLYFSPSAVSCPKSNVNPSLRPVWTRKLHDSDSIFFVTTSGYGRFYFIGLITSICRGKVKLFLLLNPYMYTQFIEQLCEAGGVVKLQAISSDVTIVTAAELPRSRTKL